MRRGSMIWGIIILVAGIMFLLDNLGLLPVSAWKVVFPAGLIILGLWFLLGPALFSKDLPVEQVSVPLDGTTEAEIKFRHGAGELIVKSDEISGQLLNGSFGGGVEHRVRQEGNSCRVKLSTPSDNFWMMPFTQSGKGLTWDVRLSKEIALKLDFKTGASDTRIDLTDLVVTDLRLETGASRCEILLPTQAGFTRMSVEAGAASIKINVPQSVAARMQVETGLSGVKVDTTRFIQSGNVYESPDYAAAANKVEIKVQAGVGSIEIV
jgi:hypothetical protein